MKTVTINELAAAQAIDFVVGPQARMKIEELYVLLAEATDAAYEMGYDDALGAEEVVDKNTYDAGFDVGYNVGYNVGHGIGYKTGNGVATGTMAQPTGATTQPITLSIDERLARLQARPLGD